MAGVQPGHHEGLGKLSLAQGQAMPGGVAGRLSPVGGIDLVEDVADVGAHRSGADEQLLGNLPVSLAGSDET